MLASLLAVGCGGFQAAGTALQGKSLELSLSAESVLREPLSRQARQWGATIASAGQQADLKLRVEQESCDQRPQLVAGDSARAVGYELSCHIRFAIADGDRVVSDHISVSDSFLYDSVGSVEAQFPARDNELNLLWAALADEAASLLLRRTMIVALAAEHE